MANSARRRKANRAGASSGLVAILAVAAIGGGVYLATQRSGSRTAVKDDPVTEVAALARAEKDREWIQRAIRERQAILGMTYDEVQRAKGPPHRKQRDDTLTEMHRSRGAVENWIYERDGSQVASVLFGANGRVIQSSDVGETPRAGQSVRQ